MANAEALAPGSRIFARAGKPPLARPGHAKTRVPAEWSEGVFAGTEREPGPRGHTLGVATLGLNRMRDPGFQGGGIAVPAAPLAKFPN
jgi:hypothetical protein